VRVGPFHQFHSGCSSGFIYHYYRFHNIPPFLLLGENHQMI
jgi:hypothetical protein